MFVAGDVFYMGRANGSSLYSVDAGTGHAFIKVDNTSVVPYQQKRDSVRPPGHWQAQGMQVKPLLQQIRISTQDFFNLGTVWVIDAYHLPWGCSVRRAHIFLPRNPAIDPRFRRYGPASGLPA